MQQGAADILEKARRARGRNVRRQVLGAAHRGLHGYASYLQERQAAPGRRPLPLARGLARTFGDIVTLAERDDDVLLAVAEALAEACLAVARELESGTTSLT